MDRFYQTMHSFDDLTDIQLNRVLNRLTHNVRI